MSETRWRLTPLDNNSLMYFGLDITNGNQAALFILRHEHFGGFIEENDRAMMEVIIYLAHEDYYDESHDAEINDLKYSMIPWNRHFDQGLAKLIDRLIHMRMANAQSVSLRLQLEMPL